MSKEKPKLTIIAAEIGQNKACISLLRDFRLNWVKRFYCFLIRDQKYLRMKDTVCTAGPDNNTEGFVDNEHYLLINCTLWQKNGDTLQS